MQNNFELPVFITIRPCSRCTIWTIFTHSGAVFMLLLAAFPGFCKFLLVFPVIYSLLSTLKKYCLLTDDNSIIEVRLNELDEWLLNFASGDIQQVQLLHPVFVHAHLVVLNFKSEKSRWRRHRVILFKNMTSSDSIRRLRVRLRYQLTGNYDEKMSRTN